MTAREDRRVNEGEGLTVSMGSVEMGTVDKESGEATRRQGREKWGCSCGGWKGEGEEKRSEGEGMVVGRRLEERLGR
ncbi:hypothetical protein OIU74_020176 [Salix koriyanagi]|uniref:Uncharacterized protein n=1 Tax=Salix koriyanagi TaxID=2511006 RepID=A0A9Q0SLJ4_9ROSI|nr:hypothetical protein OIU74_020176 [Salix koriyanagi]